MHVPSSVQEFLADLGMNKHILFLLGFLKSSI